MKKDKKEKKNADARFENNNQSKTNIEKTTPKINYRDYKDLCKKLDESIKSRDEKNIAISGIIGSGKSSLVATYKAAFNNESGKELVQKYEKDLSAQKSKDYELSENLNKELYDLDSKDEKMPSLTISLANFNITNKYIKENIKRENPTTHSNKENDTNSKKENDNDFLKQKIKDDFDKLNKFKYNEIKNDDNDKILEREIERSLLQQLVFSVNQSKIPDSKISRVIPKAPLKSWSLILFIFSIFFYSLYFINRFSLIWQLDEFIGKSSLFFGFVSLIIFISLLPLTFKIKSIKFDKLEITADNENNLNENLLSKFIDEIVYLFQQSEYEIVFFEDLDRLPNLSIFNKLREINYILNNNPDINHKITFVYCVSDNIISDYEERAKFFDNIITVKPYLTIENLKTKIEKKLKNVKGERNDDKIAAFATDMSRFMVDARLSKYIENDFVDLKQKYNKNEEKIKTEELLKIYALSIYKNLYYYDYNKISTNEACLCKSFDLIRILKYERIQEIRLTIEEEEKLLKSKESLLIGSTDMLKIILKGLISDSNITNIPYNSKHINVDSLKLDNFHQYDFIAWNGRYKDVSEIESFFINKFNISLFDYIKYVGINNEDKLNEIRLEIEKLNKDIKFIESYTISEFITKYECKDITNEFLFICLKKGYIESDYKKYLYGIDNLYLDESDDAFVRYNNDGENDSPIRNNYSYQIKEINKVISNIYLENFGIEKILNINIYNYLIEKESDSSKYKKFCNLLRSDSEEVYMFFVEYIKSQDLNKIINLVNNYYDTYNLVRAIITCKEIINSKNFNEILKTIINNVNFDFANLQKEVFDEYNNLIKYVDDWTNIEIQNEKNLIDLNVKIYNTITLKSDELIKIINNNLYEVNAINILAICQYYNKYIIAENMLEILLNSKNEQLLLTIKDNLSTFINNLETQKISSESAIKILSDINISKENKKYLIEKVVFTFKYSKKIEKDDLKEILDYDKLSYDIKSIFYSYLDIPEYNFSNYFSKEKLSNIDFSEFETITNSERYNEFIIKVIEPITLTYSNNIEIAEKFALEKIDLDNYEMDSIFDSTILKLVQNNYIKFTEKNLIALLSCYKSFSQLITYNIDDFINYIESSIINISSDLTTYILCNNSNKQLRLYLLNNQYNKIDFNFKYDGKIYFYAILELLKEYDNLDINIIKRLYSLNIDDDNIKITMLEILKQNSSNMANSQIFELISKLNVDLFSRFSINFSFSKNQSVLTEKCIKFLEDKKILKLYKRRKDYIIENLFF